MPILTFPQFTNSVYETSVQFRLDPMEGSVAFADMIERLTNFEKSLAVKMRIIDEAVMTTLVVRIKDRLDKAMERVQNPETDTYDHRKRIDAQLDRIQTSIAAAYDAQADLNEGTKAFVRLTDHITELKEKANRLFALPTEKSLVDKPLKQARSKDEPDQGESQVSVEARSSGFRERLSGVANLLMFKSDSGAPKEAIQIVDGLNQTAVYGDLAALEAIPIAKKRPMPPGYHMGAAPSPNTLWRLLEFGSGQYAKGGVRTAGKNKIGKTGAWWLGSQIILGHHPGNVLRGDMNAMYDEDRTELPQAIAVQLERYLRTGILPGNLE